MVALRCALHACTTGAVAFVITSSEKFCEILHINIALENEVCNCVVSLQAGQAEEFVEKKGKRTGLIGKLEQF